MYPNNWRGRDFTDKELDQIADLIERFYTADYRPIDKRRYTRAALQFAQDVNLIEMREKRLRPVKESRVFSAAYYAPVGAAWRIFRRRIMAEDQVGYSITKSKGWEYLGPWYSTSFHFTQNDEMEMMQILQGFDSFGLLWFQHSGTVWDIRIREGQQSTVA